MFCGDLLQIVGVTSVRQLFCLVGSWLLKYISFCDHQAKEFKVLKWLVNMFVLFLMEKCVGQSILVEANLFLAIKLQPDLTIQAILQVASILKSKLVEIESKKSLLHATSNIDISKWISIFPYTWISV